MSGRLCASLIDKIVHAKSFSVKKDGGQSSCLDQTPGQAPCAVRVQIDKMNLAMRKTEADFLFVVYAFLHFGRIVKSLREKKLRQILVIFTKINTYIKEIVRSLD